ncbi:hypothetical protein [Calothrix sp. NIES-3974]|uniref:hypothetical protein n=1 Tax=Calothrix sp. NIES-3974 TaxID=2005462 RepID=UPI000B6085B4|nr:hypothetical protein [Calothrix sp. NIES-3974]BAZ05256.1 hypothetical protein NIES3974_19020 [Calothrix sp. NIES-3974]
MKISSYLASSQLLWERIQKDAGSKFSDLLKILLLGMLILVLGCSHQGHGLSSSSWKIYKNARYGFEFPYPSNWKIQSQPNNADGVVLVSPEDESVEIRSWAANQLPNSLQLETKSQSNTNPNFQTLQGKKGILVVEATPEVNLIKLTLSHDKIDYTWQGQSPSQEFSDYYQFFYYIAQNYRIVTIGNRL